MDWGRSAGPLGLDSCVVCWASVPRTLMHFHREWHLGHERALSDALGLSVRQATTTRNALRGDAVLEACQPES